MPRLVLVLTTASRRLRLRRARQHRLLRNRSVERVRNRRGAQEEVNEVQAGQIGKPMDVPGLPGSHLEQAGKLGEPPGAQALCPVRSSSASWKLLRS